MQYGQQNLTRDLHVRNQEQQRLLKEVLSEPNWQQEAARSGLSLVLRKGALIVGLLVLCGLLFKDTTQPLVPVLICLIGAAVILLWDWSSPQAPDQD